MSIPNMMLNRVAVEIFPPHSDVVDEDAIFEARGLTRHGEILGVFGLVGSGIDELSKALFGALQRDAGKLFLHGR